MTPNPAESGPDEPERDRSRPAQVLPSGRPRPRPNLARTAGAQVRSAPGRSSFPTRRPLPGPGLVRATPDIARVAAVSAWHLLGWTANATLASANYVARRAVEGEPATAILQEAASDLRRFAWRALGLPGEAVARPVPPGDRSAPAPATPDDLQRRGGDLLRQSNDVHVVSDTHPAFSRILGEITPDEARILRFVYLDGPQPSIDIRTNRPLGIGSVLIAGGMNMIGEHAGLRNVDRINPYLTNLSRLGLIDFSKEQVANPTRYQVIEAQPKVTAAMKAAGRSPKIVQRSIRLNDFGEEFVRTCLPLGPSVVPQRPQPPESESESGH